MEMFLLWVTWILLQTLTDIARGGGSKEMGSCCEKFSELMMLMD